MYNLSPPTPSPLCLELNPIILFYAKSICNMQFFTYYSKMKFKSWVISSLLIWNIYSPGWVMNPNPLQSEGDHQLIGPFKNTMMGTLSLWTTNTVMLGFIMAKVVPTVSKKKLIWNNVNDKGGLSEAHDNFYNRTLTCTEWYIFKFLGGLDSPL